MDLGYHYSYLEVDLPQIKRNFENVQAALPQTVIPVTKGNAHGLGTVGVASMLIRDLHVKTIACAQVYEAAQVREAGFSDTAIMLLSGVPLHALSAVVSYRLLMPVYTRETVRALSQEVRRQGLSSFDIQIKVDTGLHRIGVLPEDLESLMDEIDRAGNLRVVGIYTHYINSYHPGAPTTLRQYRQFEAAVEQARRRGYPLEYIHAGCSGSALWLKEPAATHIRVGWGYIAFTPYEGVTEFFGCKQAISLRAFITAIYHLRPGEHLGYGDKVLDKPMTTATVSLGFCDGFPQLVPLHGGPVLLNGKTARCLSVCMDQTFVDVTGIDCKIGDEVTFFGKDKTSDRSLTTTEVASYGDGSSTGLHACLSDRVKRVYLPIT